MFTPVFAQILDSSLMGEDLETRWLFLTMLILADEAQTGVVDMPLDRLAIRASLSVEATIRALERLKAPDRRSRGQDDDGRRVIPMPREEGFEERGWLLVNWDKYRKETQAGLRRETVRLAVMRFRHREKGCPGCDSCNPPENQAVKAHVIKGNQTVNKSNLSNQTKAEAKQTKESTGDKPPRPRFSEPSVEEVKTYATEKLDRPDFDATAFCAYYASNGWRVGRSPMRNWKAAVVTWTRREHDYAAEAAPVSRPT